MNHDEISQQMRDAFLEQQRQGRGASQEMSQVINFTDDEVTARKKLGLLDPSVQDRSSVEGDRVEVFVDVGSWESVAPSLKSGSLVARKGWNGKGMFLFQVSRGWILQSGDVPSNVAASLFAIDDLETAPFIAMKTADNKIVPWLASQTDLLANDWEVL